MAAIVWNDVVGIAPELADCSAIAQDAILDHVNVALSVARLGAGEESSPRLRMARLLLAAHLGTLALAGAQGPAGPVVSESGGGLSVAYAAFSPAGSDPLLDSTSYGKQFRALVRNSPARAAVVL